MYHHDLRTRCVCKGRPRKRASLLPILARLSAFLLAAVFLSGASLAEDAALSQDEVNELMFEVYAQEESAGSFLVLPEGYEEPATGYDGVYHLLLVGVDSPTDKIAGRSDTMLLASLFVRQKELRLTSFMRDLYVPIPGRGHNRLNAAYAFGGADLLIRTLRDVFGIQVDGYVAVNYASMVSLVDAVGGVQMAVADHELGPLNGILSYYRYLRGEDETQGLLERPGLQQLTGLQAMSYARIRKVDSDFERVARQQRVMEAVYAKIRSLDGETLLALAFEHMKDVETNISAADAMRLISQAQGVTVDAIRTLRIPIDGAYSSKMIRGASFIIPGMKRNLAALGEFLKP